MNDRSLKEKLRASIGLVVIWAISGVFSCCAAQIKIVPAELRSIDEELVYWPLGKGASAGFLYRRYNRISRQPVSEVMWYPAQTRVHFVGNLSPDYSAGRILMVGERISGNSEPEPVPDSLLETLNKRIQFSAPPDEFVSSGVTLLVIVGEVGRGEVSAMLISGEKVFCAGPQTDARGNRGWTIGFRNSRMLESLSNPDVRGALFALQPAASFGIGPRGIAIIEESGKHVRIRIQPVGSWTTILPQTKREATLSRDEFNNLLVSVEQASKGLVGVPEESDERTVDPLLLLGAR